MRRTALPLLGALLLAPIPAAAQETLPDSLAERLNALLNDPATDRREWGAGIAAGEVVEGDLAVLDGPLDLAGRVTGALLVVNGGVTFREGAEVGGETVVVGGEVEGVEGARLGGEVRVFREPVGHCRRGGYVDLTGRCAALPEGVEEAVEWEEEPFEPHRRLRFLLAGGPSYNRVEGLPIRFGLAFEPPFPFSVPLHLRGEGIYRTESGSAIGPTRWGYAFRAELAPSGALGLRAGVGTHSRVDPIEGGHVTDLENGLSTFFLRRDFRDHYEREGASAHLQLSPPGRAWSGRLEVTRERHRTLAAGSPWTLFDNAVPWRPQPLAAEGVLTAVTLSAEVDTRSESWDPATGWHLRAAVEQALSSTLAIPAHLLSEEGASAVPRAPVDRFTHAQLDLRRYNRISPSSRVNLRAAAGGALTSARLPAQRQHALGGEGTLPAFSLFALDCGARDVEATLPEGEARYYPGYGCDRFLLAGVEYRSDLSFRLRLPRGGSETDRGEWDETGVSLTWVLFADAGAGWSAGDRLRDERAAVNLGGGVQIGVFGAYVALPVGARAGQGETNFYLRLAPRF